MVICVILGWVVGVICWFVVVCLGCLLGFSGLVFCGVACLVRFVWYLLVMFGFACYVWLLVVGLVVGLVLGVYLVVVVVLGARWVVTPGCLLSCCLTIGFRSLGVAGGWFLVLRLGFARLALFVSFGCL